MKAEETKKTTVPEEEANPTLIGVLLETQREYAHSNKMKDKIIILLIVCMLLEALSFVWYESQFEVYGTTTEITTEGDSANAEYNDVSGDMFKDNATNTNNYNGE